MSQLNWDELAVFGSTPVNRIGDLTQHQHFAQVYESDLFLLDSLASFVHSGLIAAEAVIVVATKDHLVQLEKLLLDKGVDLADVTVTGQFVTLDAAETLASFMVNGLDPELFTTAIAGIIEKAKRARPSVRIFGEMVALLWQQRNFEGAIRLEQLWNDLHKQDPFLLFCAYPVAGFSADTCSEPLGSICAQHSCVIPAESYTTLTGPDARLRAILDLQQKANALQAEVAERKQAEDRLRSVKEELKEQLRLREELLTREQMARAEAENANRMKDEFLATVSHELRTPLNAIMGWCHMIRSGRLDHQMSQLALETIDRNAKAQAQLIEDILDVSRVITGKLQLSVAPVDMAGIINAAIDSVQLAAESKGIRLAVTMDPSARHTLGDVTRLQQVVWNLLSNAIKFTSAGGFVEINLTHTDETIQICVSDNGQGISVDFLPFIFDRFRQADGTSTRKHGGLGLGLAIVRHLVELHGGTVRADSAGVGLGATFTVNLPLSTQATTGVTRHTQGERFAGSTNDANDKLFLTLENVRVLLVDNDPDTVQIVTVMLRERKANVETATSAAAALEILEWFKPDVVVSDLAMPDEDGYSLIRRIRSSEEHQQTPAVALTAYVRIEDRARALSAGFNMFVPKPVQPSELITAVANLVDSTLR